MIIVMFTFIAFYSVLTYNRNFVWKDEMSLWDDTVRKSPNKGRPYNNRGYAYMQKGLLGMAIKDFDRAILLEPDIDAGYYYNRGNAYNKKGDYDKAIADYNEAIRIKPDYAAAYANKDIANKRKWWARQGSNL